MYPLSSISISVFSSFRLLAFDSLPIAYNKASLLYFFVLLSLFSRIISKESSLYLASFTVVLNSISIFWLNSFLKVSCISSSSFDKSSSPLTRSFVLIPKALKTFASSQAINPDPTIEIEEGIFF